MCGTGIRTVKKKKVKRKSTIEMYQVKFIKTFIQLILFTCGIPHLLIPALLFPVIPIHMFILF